MLLENRLFISLPCVLILFVRVSIVDYEGILRVVHQVLDDSEELSV